VKKYTNKHREGFTPFELLDERTQMERYQDLAFAICWQAVEDYKQGIDVEFNKRFIKSPAFELLSGLDVDDVCDALGMN